MTVLHVTLKRSPRSLLVGNPPIPVPSSCAVEVECEPDEQTGVAIAEPDTAVRNAVPVVANVRSADGGRHADSSLPKSIASVTSDVGGRVMTPLALSNSVPLLSGATHEVVTAEELGLGGVSEDEVSALKQLLANAAELVVELQDQHRQSLGEMQEVAAELASAAASWLVGYAIDRNLFAVDDLIRKSLQQLGVDQPVCVRLNPLDHELLKTLMKDPHSRNLLDQMSCVEDSSMPRGSCRVESGRRILVSDMQSRLEDIRRLWMEKLDDSQVERRGDGSAARTLRRFPDRRETA